MPKEIIKTPTEIEELGMYNETIPTAEFEVIESITNDKSINDSLKEVFPVLAKKYGIDLENKTLEEVLQEGFDEFTNLRKILLTDFASKLSISSEIKVLITTAIILEHVTEILNRELRTRNTLESATFIIEYIEKILSLQSIANDLREKHKLQDMDALIKIELETYESIKTSSIEEAETDLLISQLKESISK